MFFGAISFNVDISKWDVSSVQGMHGMFWGATAFNGDISQWDVSNVTNMGQMLYGATSFTHQLGGAWSTSTANKTCMFYNCPGSIAGKTNDANGAPQ